MINYFTDVNAAHVKFAKTVWKNSDEFIRAKLAKSSRRFKSIKNTAQISITRTGIYTDSFPKTYAPSLDRICRMHAITVSDPLLEDLKMPVASFVGVGYFKRSKIKVHGCVVKLNTSANQSIFTVMKKRGLKVPTCECCGLEAKYVYVEVSLGINLARNIVTRSHNLAFYGVSSTGLEYRMTVDHILAQSEGGKNIMSNMQIMCSNCNSLKSSIPNDIFMKHREAITGLIAADAKKELKAA